MTAVLTVHRTKEGDRFWRLVDDVSTRYLSPPIWSSEIQWFVENLEAIAVGLDVGAFPSTEGAYPLAIHLHGLHALVLLLANLHREPRIQIERWSGSWFEGTDEAFRVRRYFGPENRASFGHIPLAVGWAEGLSKLSQDFQLEAETERRRCWDDLRGRVPGLSAEFPPPDSVIVEVQSNGAVRRLPWGPQVDRLVNAIVLPKPLTSWLLDACRGGRDLDQLSAQLDRVLDPKRLGQILKWSTRYTNAALLGGYFFRLDYEGGHYLYSAAQDLPAFAADPLLLGLMNLGKSFPLASEINAPGPSPQFPQGLPLSDLRDRGLIEGAVTTALGTFPRPTPARAGATVRVARGTPFMNRHRWWILQMVDVMTAALSNLPPRTLAHVVLALQRIALQCADCTNAFADYTDGDGSVALLINEARERYYAVASGDRRVAKVRRKAELPGRG